MRPEKSGCLGARRAGRTRHRRGVHPPIAHQQRAQHSSSAVCMEADPQVDDGGHADHEIDTVKERSEEESI
jgi:hypothetical protein